MFAVMVVVYVIVAAITYADYPRRNPDPTLTPTEREGLALWREHNCQACHQIFGFGGFLGPDLTNRVTDDTQDAELAWILTSGSGKMPAFNLPDEDKRAIFAFLRYVNRTGQSQPTPIVAPPPFPPTEHFRVLADAWEERTAERLTVDQRAGVDIMTRYGCGGCHVPFTVSPTRAPDLSGRAVNPSPDALQKILDNGRNRMPAFKLPRDDVERVSAYVSWLRDHRADLVAIDAALRGQEPFSWRKVPWFEYR